jgi:hypothetical protein
MICTKQKEQKLLEGKKTPFSALKLGRDRANKCSVITLPNITRILSQHLLILHNKTYLIIVHAI